MMNATHLARVAKKLIHSLLYPESFYRSSAGRDSFI